VSGLQVRNMTMCCNVLCDMLGEEVVYFVVQGVGQHSWAGMHVRAASARFAYVLRHGAMRMLSVHLAGWQAGIRAAARLGLWPACIMHKSRRLEAAEGVLRACLLQAGKYAAKRLGLAQHLTCCDHEQLHRLSVWCLSYLVAS
jgi:hypothetical protein